MSQINVPRRHYLLRRIEEMQLGEAALAGTWRWKQEQQPGTPLAAGFPFLTELSAVGYTMVEDLNGADVAELRRTVGLQTRDAQEVFAALALVVAPTTDPEPDGAPVILPAG
jgi:hypothetical protein